jgi:hypothetical protein
MNELTGKNGGPIQTAETRDVVKDHLEGLSKRFAEGLKVIESGVPAKLNGRNIARNLLIVTNWPQSVLV